MVDSGNVVDYGWESADEEIHARYTTPKLLQLLSVLKVRRLLDLGCGNGSICGTLARAGLEVVGTDYDATGIEIALLSHPETKFYQYGIHDEPLELLAEENGRKFDAVVCTEVIEHLFAPHLVPIFANAVLKERGYLLVSTPFHGFLKNLALSIADKWDFHHYSLWHGGHVKFWSRATLTTLLTENGFDVIGFYGLGRVPYLWKSFLLVAQKLK